MSPRIICLIWLIYHWLKLMLSGKYCMHIQNENKFLQKWCRDGTVGATPFIYHYEQLARDDMHYQTTLPTMYHGKGVRIMITWYPPLRGYSLSAICGLARQLCWRWLSRRNHHQYPVVLYNEENIDLCNKWIIVWM